MNYLQKIAILAVSVLAFSGPLAADLVDFGAKSKVGRVPGFELQKHQAAHYKKFVREKNYFGAFYASTTEDVAYYVFGFHDLVNAKTWAKRGCEEHLEAKGNCELVGLMLPQQMAFDIKQAFGIAQAGRKAYLKDYVKIQKPGRHGAFAVSGSYHLGYSYGWPNQAKARSFAISYCESEVAKALAELSMPDRDWAKKHDVSKCRVVDTFQPEDAD